MKWTVLGDSASDTPSPTKPAAASGNHARCLRAEPDDAWPASGSPAESTAWCPGSCGGRSRPVTATQEKLTVMDADQSGVPDGSVLAFLQRYRHVFATLLEPLSQHGDHVFMVVQKLLDQLAEASLHILILNLQSETQQKQRSSPSTSPQRFLSFPRKKNYNTTLPFPRIPAVRGKRILPGSEGNHLCGVKFQPPGQCWNKPSFR